MRAALPIAGVAALLALAGCNRSTQELSVRDTEGRRFEVRCQVPDGECALSAQGSAGRALRVQLRREGRLIGVCDAPESGPSELADCRALTCASDAECPPARGATAGSCLEGLCSDPSRALSSADAVMACLAGSGLGHAKPYQIERYALGLNCGTPCELPRPCARPSAH